MFLPRTLAAVIDQAANSGTMFVCAICLMFYGSQLEFAAFGLLATYLALVSSVQTSLIGSPLQVLAGGMGHDDRTAFLQRLVYFQSVGAAPVLATVIIGCGAGLALSDQWLNGALVLACIVAFWLRDFQRTENVILGDQRRLVGSALWCLSGAVLLLALDVAIDGAVSFAGAVFALAAPQLLTVVPMLRRSFAAHRLIAPGALRDLAAKLWPLSGWAFLGGMLVWVQNQVHLTLAAALAGVSAVAMLAAARLIVSPIASAVTGLNRLNLSRFGTEYRRAGGDALTIVRGRAIRLALLLHFAYMGLLLAAWAFGLQKFLPETYREIWDLVFLWCIFSALVSVRGCITAAVQVIEGFRWMFKLSAWGCGIALTISVAGYQLLEVPHVFVLAPLLTEMFFLTVAARRFHTLLATT